MFTNSLTQRLKSSRQAGWLLQPAASVIMVAMGLAMITGQMSTLSYWLLEQFPIFARIG